MLGKATNRSATRFKIPKEKVPLVREKPELYLSLVGSPLPKPAPVSSGRRVRVAAHSERDELERKHHVLMRENLSLRRFVTYVPNKNLPVYNWFKYKEGFSKNLVSALLEVLRVQKCEIVLDPFAGCGTTLLACKESGYQAVGMDVLPIAVYVGQVKLQDWPDLDGLIDAVNKLLSAPRRPPKTHFPNVRIIKYAFPLHVQEEILFFKEEMEKYPRPICDFLMLGLISILERVSFTSKDGHAKVEILKGDARENCLPKKYCGKIGAVIT